jgi:hypothetical protein
MLGLVIIFILFFEVVIEDTLTPTDVRVRSDLAVSIDEFEGVKVSVGELGARLASLEEQTAAAAQTGSAETAAAAQTGSAETAWYERCAVSGPFAPTQRPSVQAVAPVLLSSAEEIQLESSPCCQNMLNDKCTRDFGVDDKLRFRQLASVCPPGGDETMAAIRADCMTASRLAACGDERGRQCPNAAKRSYCSARSDAAIGTGYTIRPDATVRRNSFMKCVVGLSDHAEHADVVKCLTMKSVVQCKYMQSWGAVDASEVCMTPELLMDGCVVYSIGVGYLWEVENQWAGFAKNCMFMMFDPTPQAGPHEHVDWAAIPSAAYTSQLRQSGRERHRNVMMFHAGIADTDHVGLFNNHFVKEPVRTPFLTMRSAVSLYGRVDHHQKPDYLKLDVEGFEFHLIDQLLAERIPQLGVDFHSFDLAEVKSALVKFYLAGYDMLPGLDTNQLVAGRSLLHVKYILTREVCMDMPEGFMDKSVLVEGTCFFKDSQAFEAGGALQGNLDADTPQACQQLCLARGHDCVAFSFLVASKKCELRKMLRVKGSGAEVPWWVVRSRSGWIAGPRECPSSGPSIDVVEP